ncbi:right-handed parallel beta-helix repeat-containing protein [Methanobrevibacter millerae]|uniref:right-handed parallel beta-helix repeat-containing protein n=1 Tax=Methanobrevibacter millerae TaxID=230361 RepID=UPI00165F890F|nr:right-handed parallel beta-helix repeat-containing protein [Methanobrevibacter millerae]
MNFKEFEELIDSGAKKITLTEDVIFNNDELEYSKCINLDVDDLIIDGNNHVIDANEKSSIFVVSGKNITIKNIIFKNGYSQDFGAIINYSNNFTIECCKFSNNCSDDLGNASGGAILNKAGKINIKDSVFKENRSDYGGAIYNDSILNIENSIFDSNSSEFEGGAIYNKAKLLIHGSLFDKNVSFKGGAIYNERILNVKSCEFNNNIASDGNHIESENDDNLRIADCRFD